MKVSHVCISDIYVGISHKKVIKLIIILKKFINSLNENRQIAVHNNINQFYYMTKAEELEFLLNKYNRDSSTQIITQKMIDTKYHEAFMHWSKDARWYSTFNRQENNNYQSRITPGTNVE